VRSACRSWQPPGARREATILEPRGHEALLARLAKRTRGVGAKTRAKHAPLSAGPGERFWATGAFSICSYVAGTHHTRALSRFSPQAGGVEQAVAVPYALGESAGQLGGCPASARSCWCVGLSCGPHGCTVGKKSPKSENDFHSFN